MELSRIPVARTDRRRKSISHSLLEALRCINLYSVHKILSNNQQYVDIQTSNISLTTGWDGRESVMGCRITGRHCLVEQTYAKLTGDDVPFVWSPERASRLSRSAREHLHDLLWDETPR